VMLGHIPSVQPNVECVNQAHIPALPVWDPANLVQKAPTLRLPVQSAARTANLAILQQILVAICVPNVGLEPTHPVLAAASVKPVTLAASLRFSAV